MNCVRICLLSLWFLDIAELDLKQLRNYREKEVHGNAYRHPKKYGMLVDAKIDKPFVRNDYREKEKATQNLWRRI